MEAFNHASCRMSYCAEVALSASWHGQFSKRKIIKCSKGGGGGHWHLFTKPPNPCCCGDFDPRKWRGYPTLCIAQINLYPADFSSNQQEYPEKEAPVRHSRPL